MSGWIVLAGFVGFAVFAAVGVVRPWPKVTWGWTRVRASRLGYAAMLVFLVPLTAIAVAELVFKIDPGGTIILIALGTALAGWVLTYLAARRDIRRDPDYHGRFKNDRRALP